MLQTLKEELGPEGFERELRLARRRQERAARPKPKKVGPQESLNLLPELKRRFAELERKVEGILAQRQAAAQACRVLADIAASARMST
jgi:hypothetical protein